jgi:hypothetical protein
MDTMMNVVMNMIGQTRRGEKYWDGIMIGIVWGLKGIRIGLRRDRMELGWD